MVYHTSPTSELTLPSLFNMTSSDYAIQMDLDLARTNIYYDFGSAHSWATTGQSIPIDQPQDYVMARRYLRQQGLSLQDPTIRPATSWSLMEWEGLAWEDKYYFPMSPMKPPVQMILTTHLSAVR